MSLKTLIQNALVWSLEDPVLGLGQIGVEKETNRFKMGDGRTRWSKLLFYAPEVRLLAEANSTAPAALVVTSLESVPAGTPANTPIFVRS